MTGFESRLRRRERRDGLHLPAQNAVPRTLGREVEQEHQQVRQVEAGGKDGEAVIVRVFAALQYTTGRSELPVETRSGDTVQTLLERLANLYPDLSAKMLLPDGCLQPGINVLVNGRDVRHLDGLATPVHQGDAVALFPAAGGG